MVDVVQIAAKQATTIIHLEEGHFGDVKAIEVRPAKVTQAVSAFGNSAGGELYLGIDEVKIGHVKSRSWRGFPDLEAANAHLQVLETMRPLGNHYTATFLRCEGHVGVVLKVEVFKTREMIKASDGSVWRRKGAQTLRVDTPEGLRRLELDKGIISFEDDLVNASLDSVTNSTAIIGFMLNVVPSGEPESWLRKQALVINGKPTVAAALLFHDEPQSVLPKRSAIKIYRYRTKEVEGSRDQLDGDPVTVEGCLYDLIYAAVAKTKSIIEGIQKLTDRGLEAIVYPDETLHEIITNAVLHRDYSIQADVHIRIYDNRVEVQSPGRLPGHVTTKNILTEQAARNGRIVRLINKFPDPPNKDVGEGLNTAFAAMTALKLRHPEIIETDTAVVVHIRHTPLASPEVAVMDYLEHHDEITNSIARDLTGIPSENTMKEVFYKLRRSQLLEQVPSKKGNRAAWRRWSGATQDLSEDPPD